MIKDGQIFVTILRTIGSGVPGVSRAGTCWTDEGPNTIGGKQIIIVGEIPLVRPSPYDLSVLNPSKAAKAPPSFRDLAPVHAQRAGQAKCRAWRIFRESVCAAAVHMNPFDFWPNLPKMPFNTVRTKADNI